MARKTTRKVVSVYVEQELWEKVRRVSVFTNQTLSSIVTTALNFYFSYRKGDFEIMNPDGDQKGYTESREVL